jgi:hypothetical protein
VTENKHHSIAKLEIVVQNVASFRIDPAVLSRPDRSLVLICSPSKNDSLRTRGRVDVFDEVVVIDDFGSDSLAKTVRDVIAARGGDEVETRLLCHDEYSLGAVAAVREKLGIPGDRPVNVRPFIDKLAMKAALAGHDIRMPRYAAWDAAAYARDADGYVAEIIAAVGLPAFVKPVNESGAVGATRIGNAAQLRQWADAAQGWEFEIDEFIDGTLYHVDSAVQDGSPIYVRANQDLYPCHEYTEGKINSTFTLPADDPVLPVLLEFNERVLGALTDKPRHSAFHHEIFINRDGEPVFLEIAARAPAALIPMTGRIRWGVDIEEAHFALQRGEPFSPPTHYHGPFAAFVFFPKRAGTVVALDRPDLVSSHRWTWNIEVGDVLDAATDDRDFAASVLLWNDDFATLRRDLDDLDRATPFEVA